MPAVECNQQRVRLLSRIVRICVLARTRASLEVFGASRRHVETVLVSTAPSYEVRTLPVVSYSSPCPRFAFSTLPVIPPDPAFHPAELWTPWLTM
jgi:hypothetical protein